MYALKPHVAIVPQGNSVLLIDKYGDVPNIRVGANQLDTLIGLQRGNVHSLHHDMLEVLLRYGLLEGTNASLELTSNRPKGCIILPNPDAILEHPARILQLLPSKYWKLLFFCFFSYGAVSSLIWLSQVGAFSLPIQPLWLVLYLALSIAGHELSHALVIKYHGLKISSVGIKISSRIFPTPYVATRGIPLLRTSFSKASIPMAGPAWDLALLTLVVTIDIFFSDYLSSDFKSLLPSMAVLQLILLSMNITPFKSSDGLLVAKYLMQDEHGKPLPCWPLFLLIAKYSFTILILIVLPYLFIHQWF